MQTRSMKVQEIKSTTLTSTPIIRRSARIQSKNNSLNVNKLIAETKNISNTDINIYTVDIDFDDARKEWRKNKIHLGNCVFKYI